MTAAATSAARREPRVALVTGGSSGIGLAVARTLALKGYRVLATSRNPEAVANKIAGVTYLPLDLTDYASIEAVAELAGPVDILINNAGESQSGPIEELPTEAIERLFRANVFGAVRLTQLVLPGMREQGYGKIVMVGSMLGSFPLAYRSSYSAAKAALRTFADAARLEVSPFGVDLITVEPGSINTGISTRRTKYVGESSVYRNEFETVIGVLDANEAKGITAEKVADVIVGAVEAAKPKPFYAVGSNAPLVFLLKRLLPSGALPKLAARRHGLRR